MKSIFKKILKHSISFLMILALLLTMGLFSLLQTDANDLTGHLPATGYVNSDGVYGYTTDYVCNGGAKKEEHKVENGWHITMKDSYYSHEVTWFQCWDTDDGDYYGWIDGRYITVLTFTNHETEPPISNNPVTVTSISPRTGEVNGTGVYGYKSSYACYTNGTKETEHKVSDGWHITAYNQCTSHNVTWYECWDTDDGDYYGWIDADYLLFYDTITTTAKQVEPVPAPDPGTTIVTVTQKVAVTKKVMVTEKEMITNLETITVPVTVTIPVTITVTEPEVETTETTTIAPVIEDTIGGNIFTTTPTSTSKNTNSNSGIILIGAAIVILMASGIALIILFTNKSRKVGAITENKICPKCGSVYTEKHAKVCGKCGTPLQTILSSSTSTNTNSTSNYRSNRQVKYCPRCGKPQTFESAGFCDACGASLQ